jgi:hypothetical protein
MQRRRIIVGLGCLAASRFVVRARHTFAVTRLTSAIPISLAPTLPAVVIPIAGQMRPDRLVVTRTKNNLNAPDAPPFSKTITDRATVEKLYQDIQALPPMPTGRFGCPMDAGVTYRLDFFSGGTPLLSASYTPTGCASVALSDGMIKSDMSGGLRAELTGALDFASERELLGYPR